MNDVSVYSPAGSNRFSVRHGVGLQTHLDLRPLLQVDFTIELLNDLIALTSRLFEFLPIENPH